MVTIFEKKKEESSLLLRKVLLLQQERHGMGTRKAVQIGQTVLLDDRKEDCKKERAPEKKS